ncbi:2,3-diaminopropionate biosynthesis protein SbnA [Nocardia gamkensis]|uniref:2,3-diaminopropionate biosynthesis protein SbnA n=1 Tax=Nocardia gamkensis TaxID=352869 RepID=A0A7X6LB53_9NOCA|nr:2,3-diaminopropionate biosynthesis protein SbnA [Nocardia gamkensis]NKY31212.1 2,3-diaminopropionate biosynthesis protein SbnA [Nocardia gamkensis]NQE71948.1 Cysteine synthase [Nocardia gamkensis]
MGVLSSPYEDFDSDLYVDASSAVGRRILLKCEGLNLGGSIKMRSAAAMIGAAVANSTFDNDSILVESSSGNLGIALSATAASMGLRFVCVTDIRCNRSSIHAMRAMGAQVVVLDEPDPIGGLLLARLNWIRARLTEDDRYIWLDQYSNQANWQAHYHRTAAGIHRSLPDLDVLFVGVGTGGTAMGCARYFADSGRRVRVVAVDPVGSVAFGHPPQRRLIPGLGAGIVPPLLDRDLIDDVVRVAEADTVRMCRTLASRGLLFGGSTGTVVHGAQQWLEDNDPAGELLAVAIAPDFGDRYLDTIYNDAWVLENFCPAALEPLSTRSVTIP